MPVYAMKKPANFLNIEEKDFEFLNSRRDLSESILTVANILQLSKDDYFQRQCIWDKIIKFLRPYYPHCIIEPFGSSANGFGLKGCDLDLLFLPFPAYCNSDFKDNEDVKIPIPREVLENDNCKEMLLTMNETCHLKFVRCILSSKRWFFKKVIFIPAKCPILNMHFLHTDITCDFSASNRLVLCNTKLQWLYGSLDSRVRSLVMFLRHWAKALGFIQKSQLSSYAFTFMVIFYLQNTQPPLLPSVESLIKLSGQSFKIDGWETAVCENLNIIPQTRNSDSLEKLLLEFFDFYWNFDFTHDVVSPHFGKAMPFREFSESNDERIKTFQVTPFSIQDPFILSRNISRNSTMQAPFKLSLCIAKKLLLERESFQKFFDYSNYQADIDKLFPQILDDRQESSMPCILYLNNEFCRKLNSKNVLHHWYENACQAVLNTLQYGLLFECEVIDKVRWKKPGPRPKKKRKLYHGSKSNLELIMSIQCAVYYDTWSGRKKTLVSKTDTKTPVEQSPLHVLEQEHVISSNLIQSQEAVSYPLMWFYCNCYKHSSPQISDIILTFSHLTNKKLFSSLSYFIKPYVCKLVKRVLSGE